ncbi:hypothetical protein [Herbaspirillum autotrophicum]|uniref:hypothetical protein n=1 Tax=Herbaspirillum autotrophicum TaxID=180195 RepID=UPI00067CCCD4|nr:hypothetical protein [Herbaspirillum autotrophicum]
MLKYLQRVCDVGLLLLAALLFGAILTARLQTGSLGLLIPEAPYIYERRDFVIDAVMAALAGWVLLLLAERLVRERLPQFAEYGCFAIALLLSMYWGPPSPLIFGNTWGAGEATRELFLAHMDIIVPLLVMALVLRTLLRSMLAAWSSRKKSVSSGFR